MEYITITVVCIGCGKPIDTPSEADMDLFRNGVHVHSHSECLELAEKKLAEVFGSSTWESEDE